MKQNHVRLWIGSLILLLILTACSSSTQPAASTNNDGGSGGDVQVAEDIDAGRGEDAVVEDAGIEETTVSPDTTNETGPKTAAADRPAWQTVPLTDVRTGETFTLADYAGKVIIVETMAVWCPFCDQQQMQINSALSELGENAVGVSLDVDPGETADIVIQHADDLGLDWHFAIAGPELSSMLQNEFGPQVLAPPSTPVLIIAPDGTTELTPFGIKGWDFLVERADAAME